MEHREHTHKGYTRAGPEKRPAKKCTTGILALSVPWGSNCVVRCVASVGEAANLPACDAAARPRRVKRSWTIVNEIGLGRTAESGFAAVRLFVRTTTCRITLFCQTGFVEHGPTDGTLPVGLAR